MGYVFRRSTAFRVSRRTKRRGETLGQERHRAERQHSKHLVDEWSGFADLLANLIEKYAAVLDIDNLPEPPSCLEEENTSEEPSDTIELMEKQ